MAQQSRRKTGSKFEDKVKKSVGSGNLWFSPLDLKDDTHYIECKYTDKKGYRVATALLEKIWGQSLSMNKEPALVIGIKRNENEIFVLRCDVNIERREGLKC
jgi:hypothetical protein